MYGVFCHKIEGKLSEKQNREDTMAIVELRDIHDELQSLRKLFDQQKEIITEMGLSTDDQNVSTSLGMDRLFSAKLGTR